MVRPWRLDDASVLATAWSDPDVIIGSSPPTDRSVEAAASWISGAEARADDGIALDVAIVDPDTDRVMGEVGVSRFEPHRRAAVVGWWVGSADRGRHVATNAVGLFVEWLLEPGRLNHVLAEISAGNEASTRVAENAGFRLLRAADAGRAAVFVRDSRAKRGERP